MTLEQLIEYLQRPGNEGQIKHLAHLKHVKNVENVGDIPGIGGMIARFVLRMTQGHMDAVLALAECETVADLEAFTASPHYRKVRKIQFGDIESLDELDDLEDLEEAFQNLNLGK